MDTESLEDSNDGPQGPRFSETTFQKYGQTVTDEPLCGPEVSLTSSDYSGQLYVKSPYGALT